MPEVKHTDRYYAAYLIILLNGFGILMPWNMWITVAPAYYVDYKLVQTFANGTTQATPYALNFLSYLGLASNLPNFILNLINLFITIKGDLVKRIGSSILIMGLICLITLIFTFIDTSQMITIFFVITIITVILQNAACGVYQNSLYGLAATLPLKYTGAIVLGNNICGTFVSIINIISLLVTTTVQLYAFVYFTISLLAVLACFASLFLLVKLDFYKFHVNKAKKGRKDQNLFKKIEGDESTSDETSLHSEQSSKVIQIEENETNLMKMNFWSKLKLYYSVFKKIQLQCFNVWFVFFVTLTLFPTVMADIEYYSKSGKYDFIIPEKFFTSITTYLLFNSCACFGSFLANFINWPKPKWLIAPVLCQAIFIPLMLFCNFRPHYRTWKIWIYDIRIYIIMAIVMSIGSGFYSAKAMMYAPKLVEVSKSTVAGMISAFFLIFGVLCGVSFTLVVSWFINSAGPYQPGKY